MNIIYGALYIFVWYISYRAVRASRNKTEKYLEDEHAGIMEKLSYKIKHIFISFFIAMMFFVFIIVALNSATVK